MTDVAETADLSVGMRLILAQAHVTDALRKRVLDVYAAVLVPDANGETGRAYVR